MLGFLGTVQGMIVAFGDIEANIGQQNIVQAAASGIRVALLTTAFGLIVGIPAYMAFNYFTGIINELRPAGGSVRRRVDRSRHPAPDPPTRQAMKLKRGNLSDRSAGLRQLGHRLHPDHLLPRLRGRATGDRHAQRLPKTEPKTEKRDQSQNLEVSITPTSIVLNGSPLQLPEFARRIPAALKLKTQAQADRIVVGQKRAGNPLPDAGSHVSQAIDQAGGILTLELESERTINVE